MASGVRLIFPADRTAFVYRGPGQAITVPDYSSLQIFVDEAATTLAAITTLAGEVIGNSTIYTDDAGLFPEFFGPPDAVRLWGKSPGAVPFPLDANYGNRLSAIAGSFGVPVDGSTGQVLRKVSPADFDTEWVDPEVTAAQVSDASQVGRQVLTAASLKTAREALGLYVQPTNPSAAWGSAQRDFIWIETPL